MPMSQDRWRAIQQNFITPPYEQWLIDQWNRAMEGAGALAQAIRARLFPQQPPPPPPRLTFGPPAMNPLATPDAVTRWNQIRQAFIEGPPREQALLAAMRRFLGLQ